MGNLDIIDERFGTVKQIEPESDHQNAVRASP